MTRVPAHPSTHPTETINASNASCAASVFGATAPVMTPIVVSVVVSATRIHRILFAGTRAPNASGAGSVFVAPILLRTTTVVSATSTPRCLGDPDASAAPVDLNVPIGIGATSPPSMTHGSTVCGVQDTAHWMMSHARHRALIHIIGATTRMTAGQS